jgi:hypothetical protein
MTEKCRISIISKPSDSNKKYVIFLGDVNEKDKNYLDKLHNELRFLCDFKAIIKESNIIPDNYDEILSFQIRHNIVRKIWFTGVIEETTLSLLAPELYDTTCMVPLFSESIPRSVSPKGVIHPGIIFIFPPFTDPFIRGKLVDICFDSADGREMFFYLMGGPKIQKIRASELTKRYLLSCKVEDKNIICGGEECKDVTCIKEAINMVNFFSNSGNEEVLIVVNRPDLNNVMNYIRSEKILGLIDKKVRLLCD